MAVGSTATTDELAVAAADDDDDQRRIQKCERKGVHLGFHIHKHFHKCLSCNPPPTYTPLAQTFMAHTVRPKLQLMNKFRQNVLILYAKWVQSQHHPA